jgi:hypothetical protein
LFPIVGGSGAFAGAKGYIRVRPLGANSPKSYNTIVITG